MPLNVLSKIEINCSCVDVANYMFEPSNDPVWIGGISEAKILTSEAISKGTQVQRTAKFMGKTIEYILEITEFEKDLLMVMNSIKSPFPMRVTYQLKPFQKNTTLTQIRVEGTAKGFYSIGDFFMAPMVRRNISNDLKRLKIILEL